MNFNFAVRQGSRAEQIGIQFDAGNGAEVQLAEKYIGFFLPALERKEREGKCAPGCDAAGDADKTKKAVKKDMNISAGEKLAKLLNQIFQNGKTNPAAAIFLMKNMLDHKDVQDVVSDILDEKWAAERGTANETCRGQKS